MSKLDKIWTALGFENKNQFAEFLGMNNSYISTYGKRDSYGKKFVAKLKKKIPNLNEGYLLSGSPEMFVLEDRVAEKSDNLYKRSSQSIHIYSRISAGSPAQMWNEAEFIMSITHPALDRIKKDLFGFIVSGDSMRPRFTEGDIVICKLLDTPDEKPKDKDFVVTTFNSDGGTSTASLKLFNWKDRKKKEFILSSINTKYSPSVHHLREVRNIFRVYLIISQIDYKEKSK